MGTNMYEQPKRNKTSNSFLWATFTICQGNGENVGFKHKGYPTRLASINLSSLRKWTSVALEVLLERRGNKGKQKNLRCPKTKFFARVITLILRNRLATMDATCPYVAQHL